MRIAPEYFEIDMSAAVENLLLQADALGLGAVWMGIAPDQGRMDAVRKVLDIPENLHAFALVPCGYPAEERAQEDRYDVNRVHYVGSGYKVREPAARWQSVLPLSCVRRNFVSCFEHCLFEFLNRHASIFCTIF